MDRKRIDCSLLNEQISKDLLVTDHNDQGEDIGYKCILIQNLIITGDLKLCLRKYSSAVTYIKIHNCEFESKLRICCHSKVNDIKITNVDANYLEFDHLAVNSYLVLENCGYLNSVSFSNVRIDNILFRNNKKIDSLKFYPSIESKYVSLVKCQIKECIVNLPKFAGVLDYFDVSIDYLKLFQGDREAIIDISDLRVNQFEIYNCTSKINISDLRISNDWNYNRFVILDGSDFDTSSWSFIDFTKFDFVNVINVRFGKLTLFNVKWGNALLSLRRSYYHYLSESENPFLYKSNIKKIELLLDTVDDTNKLFDTLNPQVKSESNEIPRYSITEEQDGYGSRVLSLRVDFNYYYSLKELKRQLKLLYSSNKDMVMETHFHRKEMLAYSKSLGKWKFNNFWQKLILLLSELTGEFGTSVWRPVVFMSLATFIALCVLIGLDQFKDVKLGANSWDEFCEGFEIASHHFFPLINPVFKDDNLKMTFWSGFIKTLLLVWNSYMIYNFIRATRRYIN